MGGNYKWIQISLILGLILTMVSIFSNYKADEYNIMSEDNSLAALGKCLLAIDANQDHQNEEYKNFMSDSKIMLETYAELNKERQFWVIVRDILTILGLSFNVLALLLIQMKEEKTP
jgi:hypothetical protein